MSEENTIKKVDYSKNPVVLSASHVSKCFKLPTEQATGLKQAFINWARGIKGYKKQEVLKDISFEVHQGEFFGIVGRNGGGKSTLLKLISQIYYPENGSITVSGKLVPYSIYKWTNAIMNNDIILITDFIDELFNTIHDGLLYA